MDKRMVSGAGPVLLSENVLIVGDWSWPQYEASFSAGLRDNGFSVKPFVSKSFFRGQMGKVERNLSLLGPSSIFFNFRLFREVVKGDFDLVLLWRVTELHPLVAKKLAQKVTLVSYNNDDPFGSRAHKLAPWHHRFLWRWYLRYLKFCHVNFFYRPINREESLERGSRVSEVLMPYFIPERDRPVQLGPQEEIVYKSDVAFVGHFEPDGRDDMLASLIQSGYKVKLWGSKGWQSSKNTLIKEFFPTVEPALGEAYAKAICGAKVSLAFLSKLNRDTYTRRCFEIPAMGGLLLAERTEDLLKLFAEDEEACFFEGEDELLDKVSWLLNNPLERARIAKAGQAKVWSGNHHVSGRALEFLTIVGRYRDQIRDGG